MTLTKSLHSYKVFTHLQSLYTLTKYLHTYKVFTHLQSLYTLTKSLHTYKAFTHLQSLYTLTKSLHTYKAFTHLQNLYTLTKSLHTYKAFTHLLSLYTLTKSLLTYNVFTLTKSFTQILYTYKVLLHKGPLWPWSDGSWIYNYLCNRCLSPLMLWVRITLRERCTTFCDKVFQWLAAGLWFSLGPPVSATNKTDRHDIAEILLKVALSTIKPTNQPFTQSIYTVAKYLYTNKVFAHFQSLFSLTKSLHTKSLHTFKFFTHKVFIRLQSLHTKTLHIYKDFTHKVTYI